MLSHLQLVLLMHFVGVYSQTCFTECLTTTTGDATTVNIMVNDGSFDPIAHAYREWLDSMITEFNRLYPAISVTPHYVIFDNMVTEALRDLDTGTNMYHGYVIPGMNVFGGTSVLVDRLMDLSTFTVDNVNGIEWQTIGRFYRAHSSLYEGKVLTLPLAGDFFSLLYREDVFASLGRTPPRTLEEYVRTSHDLNGTDLNGDGVPDYGSCIPQVGDGSSELFYVWTAQTLQYRGTTEGSLLDTDTLTPLLQNPVVQEAIKLWKQAAGPPTLVTTEEFYLMILSGRCAMAIWLSSAFTLLQTPLFHGTIGTAIMPGSQKVWSRDRNTTIMCNRSSCRHGTQYPDGLVVNHAPGGQSMLDGAVNGQIEFSKQLAAYTFLTWLMKDANLLEAVVAPPAWPNLFAGTFVRPRSLVPSTWIPYGWRDPAISMYCATLTMNMEHSNAAVGLRLPNSQEYFDAMSSILTSFLKDEDVFGDLDDDEGAIVASMRMTTALQEVTDRWDRDRLIATYQKSLNIFVEKPTQRTARTSEVFPSWAVHAVVGMLGGSLCLAVTVSVCWLTSTLRQRQRLLAKQQEARKETIVAAVRYSSCLGCPFVLVRATDFIDLGCLVKYEHLREEGKLRVLDTVEKLKNFHQKFLILFLSHQSFAWGVPDPSGMHHKTMCAAARTVAKAANVGLDSVFLWVDFSSVPQEWCEFKLWLTFWFCVQHPSHGVHMAFRRFVGLPHLRNTWQRGSCSSLQCPCTCCCQISS